MKLSLLEDGVLDYKGNARVLAIPNANPVGSLGAGVKPAPKDRNATPRGRFEEHVNSCPQCKESLCDVGRILAKNL